MYTVPPLGSWVRVLSIVRLSIRRCQPLNKIVTRVNTWILLSHRLPCTRQRLDVLIEVGIAKVSDTVARRHHVGIIVVPRRWLDDAVLGALDLVVAPATQQVAGIHHDGILDWCGAHPRAMRRLDLQPAGGVLEQQRDGAVVGVLTGAHLVRVLEPDGLGRRRVVQQAQSVVASAGKGVEEVQVEAHAQGDGAHHLSVQVLERQEEGLHCSGEGSTGGVKLVWPLVGQARDALAPDLERFFQVGVAGAKAGDLSRVRQLRHFLTARSHVAAVGRGRRPAEQVFLGLRALEEASGVGKGGGNGIFGHAVVLQVEEAGGLEGVEDLLGRGQLFRGGPVEEGAEVNELGAVNERRLA
jgi:hypothetical protein